MATKRRIGVSTATTEAARRQLMQPVPCWEKVWTLPESGPPSFKVCRWVKTEKIQQFSDDEGEVDEPLAPLPDEPEVADGEEDADQDETIPDTQATQVADAIDLAATQDDLPSKPPSPKPRLSISLQNSSELNVDEPGDVLDASLKPLDEDMDVRMDLIEKENPSDGIGLDISGLGPDGLGLESSHDLSQLEAVDALVGGQTMDQSVDPFAEPAIANESADVQ